MSHERRAGRAATTTRPRWPTWAVFVGGPVALVAVLALHVTQGAANLSPRDVLAAIVSPDGSLAHDIVLHLRLPRAAAGVLAGAALGVAGALLQATTRNPLASPATLGVNAGAFLAVVAAAALAPGVLNGSPVSVAFVGGVAAAALVYVVAGGMRATPVRLALAGVAVTLALSAVAAALQIFFENATAGLFFWGAGTLLQRDWQNVREAAPLAAAGVAVALASSRALDVLALGDDAARALGQRVRATRLVAALTGVFLAAVSVSVVGPIGFVGLVAPHLVRLMGHRRHLPLFVGAAIWGAVVLVAADAAARVANGVVNELPAGVVTALVGAPLLVYLARREGGQRQAAAPVSARAVATSRRLPHALLLAGGVVALLATLLAGLSLGTLHVAPADAVRALMGESGFTRRIVVDLRLPRLLVAAGAGAALAASGLLLQGVVRNPLAAPETLGVTSGAGLGALAVMLALPGLPVQAVPAAAALGAFAAFGIAYAAAWRNGLHPVRLALVGIAVSAFCAAAVSVIVVKADVRVAEALVWLAGSTYARTWDDWWRLAPWLALLLPVAWLVARDLDLLALGDDAARSVGTQVERARALALVTGVALAAAAVATVGVIGFVGLVAPHAARLLGGSHHRRLLPIAVLLGAALVTGADVVGRVVASPREIPSGLVTALVGTPYFLWLLWRTSRA